MGTIENQKVIEFLRKNYSQLNSVVQQLTHKVFNPNLAIDANREIFIITFPVMHFKGSIKADLLIQIASLPGLQELYNGKDEVTIIIHLTKILKD